MLCAPVSQPLTVTGPALEWLDCEAFERRHPLGRGSLVLLDAPQAPGGYETRQRLLAGLVNSGAVQPWGVEQFVPPENTLLHFAYVYEPLAQQAAQVRHPDPDLDPLSAWSRLQSVNQKLGCDLFEGLVAKRADSTYPRQLRSASEEFAFWVKHRWAF